MRRTPSALQVEQQKLNETLKLAQRALMQVFGPAWKRFDKDTRQNLVTEVYTNWFADSGGAGEPDLQHLVELAQAVRRAGRAEREKELQAGEQIEREAVQFDDPLERQLVHDASERRAETLESRLRNLARSADAADRTRAALVGLHVGEPVVPGQPSRFLRPPKGGRAGPDPLSQAEKDLKRFHPGGSRCPTCRAISRFVRVPGLGPREVSQIVDAFAIRLQQELG